MDGGKYLLGCGNVIYRDGIGAWEVSQSKGRRKLGWVAKISDRRLTMTQARKKWKKKMEKKMVKMDGGEEWSCQMLMAMSPS